MGHDVGELLTQSAAGDRARNYHAQALAIARDLGAPLEEARALEGTGQSHFRDGSPGEGAALLRQAPGDMDALCSGPEHLVP